jgi:hypothetical protein
MLRLYAVFLEVFLGGLAVLRWPKDLMLTNGYAILYVELRLL